MSWNEEKVNKLKELWGKGNTASQIAEIIGGISRNAVPRWEAWLRTHSGKRVAARSLGESGYKILAQAPGTYVKETPEL